MRRIIHWTCLLVAVVALPCFSATPDSLAVRHEYCGGGPPDDQALGFVALPEGDVFCPLLADPKGTYSYIAYVRSTSTSPLGTDLGSFGIADHFAFARWGGPRPGEGFQIGLEGSVFGELDLNSESYDLLNADYVLGIPMSYRYGWFSGRARVYHQSSHLGDELLLRSHIDRKNFSFESAEGILSVDGGPFRLYAGGEYLLHSLPTTLQSWVAHGGMEFRYPKVVLRLGDFASGRFVAGGDAKSVEYIGWETAVSAVAGLEFSRPRGGIHTSRNWSVLGHYYTGPSPYGQFFHSNVTYYGMALHFAL